LIFIGGEVAGEGERCEELFIALEEVTRALRSVEWCFQTQSTVSGSCICVSNISTPGAGVFGCLPTPPLPSPHNITSSRIATEVFDEEILVITGGEVEASDIGGKILAFESVNGDDELIGLNGSGVSRAFWNS